MINILVNIQYYIITVDYLRKMQKQILIEVKEIKLQNSIESTNIKIVLKQTDLEKKMEKSKQETKKDIIINNNKSLINQKFKFIVAQNNLKNTKITLIIMTNKIKQIAILGLVSIELKKWDKINFDNITLPIQKSNDIKGQLIVSIKKQEINTKQNLQFQKVYSSIKENKIEKNPPNPKQSNNENKNNTSKQNISPNLRNSSKKSSLSNRSQKNANSKSIIRNSKQKNEVKGIKSNNNLKLFQKKPAVQSNRIKSPMPRKTPESKFENRKQKYDSKSPSYKSIRFNQIQQKKGNLNKQVPNKKQQNKYKSLTDKLQQIDLLIQEQKKQNKTICKDDNTIIKNEEHSQKHEKQTGYRTQSVCTFGQSEQHQRTNNIKQFTNSVGKQKIHLNKDLINKQQMSLNLLKAISGTNSEVKFSEINHIQNKRINQLQQQKIKNENLIEKLTNQYQKLQHQYMKQIENINQSHSNQLQGLNNIIDKLTLQNTQIKKLLIQKVPTNLEQQLLKQKNKVLNLSNELRYKQNELKFCKLNQQFIKDEKKQLEKQLNNCYHGKKQKSFKFQAEYLNNLTQNLKKQNKLLKDQLKHLLSHIQQLNKILQNQIKYHCFNKFNQTTIPQNISENIRLKELHRINEQINSTLCQRASLLQIDLVKIKNSMIEVISLVFQKADNGLIKEIQQKICIFG